MKQGWEITNIGSIADITDYVANGSFATLRENVSYLNDNGYAILVRLADYTNNFDKGKFVYIDEHAYDFLSKSKLFGGEIIMSNVGSIGKSFICPDLGMPMSLAPNSIVIRTSNNPFYHYLFQSDYFQTELRAISSQTALPKFNKTSFKKINVPVPPIAEQEKIVAELDCLSGIIEKKKQQLKELDNLAQSIFYEMFGDPVENDKGWEVKKIGEVCIVERGGSPRPINAFITDDENGVNWIKIGDATEGSRFITSTKEKIIPEGVRKSRMVYKGDFILSNSMSFGRPYIMGIDGCIHDGWLVLRDKDNVFDKTYLYYYLGSSHVYQEFKRLAVGGVVNNLNSELVRGVRVAIPSFSVQQDFASKIESIEKQKELIAQSIKETETLFNSRMDYYFN